MTAKSSDWRPGPSVCRCCFAEGCYKDISTEYFWMGKREVYQEMLSTTFDVSISYAQSGGPNSNSRLICEPCIARLRDASDFKRQVQECERVFHQHLDPTSSVSELEVVVEPPGKEVKLERVKVESKLSDDEDFDDHAFVDDDDDDLDDQPLTALATKVPKKESVDLMDLLDNAKPEKRKAAAKPKTPPAKKAKKKESPKPSASKPAPKPVEKKRKGLVNSEQGASFKLILDKKDKSDQDSREPVKITWKRVRRLQEGKETAAFILENSNAVVFKWKRGKFMCAYCSFTSNDMIELRQHSSGHEKLTIFGQSKSNIIPLRVDISDLTCNICNQLVETIDNLKTHLAEVHSKNASSSCEMGDGVVPFVLTKQDFKCVNCDQKFLSFMNLILHMNEHYQYFVCDTCGKSFSSHYKLQRHTRIHETESSECPNCGVVLPNRNARNRHMTTVHGPKERYSCPICNTRWGSYHARLRHLEREHGRKSEYPCNVCASVFATGTIRNAHIRAVHNKIFKSKKKEFNDQ